VAICSSINDKKYGYNESVGPLPSNFPSLSANMPQYTEGGHNLFLLIWPNDSPK
jgi:hypothetical protein